MARGLGRSKGCKICLLRKIKCDEKTPSCTQCTRGGRHCSGALSTVFLVVESETLNTNPTYKPRDAEQSSEASHTSKPSTLVKRTKKNHQTTRRSSQFETPISTSLLGEPILSPAIDSSCPVVVKFLSHFVAYFARVSSPQVVLNSWLAAVPDMLASESSVTKRSTIAATTVYFRANSVNPSILVESYKWYAEGIEKQRELLQELQRHKRLPTVEEICNPILLSFFEITCNTSMTGYFQHLTGAARLLEMRGPKDCASGILHHLLITLRIQLIHPALVMRMPSIFSSEEWLTIPFQCRPKSAFDRVIDTNIILSTVVYRLDATRSVQDFSEARAQRLLLQAETINIKEQLYQWWDKELREASQSHGWTGDFFRGISGFDFDFDRFNSQLTHDDDGTTGQPPEKSNTVWHDSADPSKEFKTPFYSNQRSIAFYNTATVLTLSILNELLDAPPSNFETHMQAHSESILSIATRMTRENLGYAYVRLVLPLTVVWHFSPLEIQKGKAKEILSSWKMGPGVGAFSEVVLSDMQEDSV